MTYATSSPAATTGGQGNTPVSCPPESYLTKESGTSRVAHLIAKFSPTSETLIASRYEPWLH